MARLMLLIPSSSYRTADFLAAAGPVGVDLVVATDSAQALAAGAEGRIIRVDFRDIERGTVQIVDHARAHPLDAVLAVDGEGAVLAAAAGRALGLKHNPPDAVQAAQNKYLFRQALAEAGLPGPAFRVLTVDQDAAAAAARQRYPCILKPLSLAASRGVIRADDPGDFVAAFRRIAAILARGDATQPPDAAGRILIEDFLPGTEIAVEGLLNGGRLTVLAIFDKPEQSDGPYFEETIYVAPSALPEATQARAIAMVADAVAALGLREGPIHAELRIDETGARMIELDARSLGGHCARALRFAGGARLEELILRHALGRPIASLDRESDAVGLMMIPIPRRGRLRAVRGRAAAAAVSGIRGVSISIPTGRIVEPPPEGGRYLGFIFSHGETRSGALAALRCAHAALDFDIVAVDGVERDADVAKDVGVG